MTIETHDLAEFKSAARELGDSLSAPVLVLLSGNLGAGKTTFVAEALLSRGIKGANSPTFNLRNDYDAGLYRVIHLDLYRLRPGDSAADILPPDEDYSDAIVFVEWPEKAPAGTFGPFEKKIHLHIEANADGGRRFEWQTR